MMDSAVLADAIRAFAIIMSGLILLASLFLTATQQRAEMSRYQAARFFAQAFVAVFVIAHSVESWGTIPDLNLGLKGAFVSFASYGMIGMVKARQMTPNDTSQEPPYRRRSTD